MHLGRVPEAEAEQPPHLTHQAAPISVSAIVGAILKVGHQRRVVLDQLRSALILGNDAAAIHLARQLCGLAV
jgi:hypothetical protein